MCLYNVVNVLDYRNQYKTKEIYLNSKNLATSVTSNS